METTLRELPLADLGDTWGPKPVGRLVENIRDNGVIVPIVVAETTDDDGAIAFRLIDGNRRVAASRLAGRETIPTMIVRGYTDPQLAQLTLLANSMRNFNLVTEWWAIDELLHAGSTRNDLAAITGLSPSTVENRLQLRDLDPRLFEGLAAGDIAPTVAMAAARLPADIQHSLAGEFARTGRLPKASVDAATADVAEPDQAATGEPDDLAARLLALAGRAAAQGLDADAWTRLTLEAWVASVAPPDDE